MTEKEQLKACYCTLNRVFGYNPSAAHLLLARHPDVLSIFDPTDEDACILSGPFSKLPDLAAELDKSYSELRELSDRGYRFVSIADDDFPPLLKECPDCPVGLYVRSCSEPPGIFSGAVYVSIVGTRDISLYGKEWCERIIRSISSSRIKPVVVSGLAFGTDITAHLTALECGLPTIGVLPTGIDTVYPWAHYRYARRIAETPGCALVTDYPRGTPAIAINFLRRNRIIAGMSSATILIESKNKGGGMVTANLAFSYDRNVLALPGRIDDIRSQGCNKLIRLNIAEPVTDLEALPERLGLDKPGERDGRRTDSLIRERYSGQGDPSPDDILKVFYLIKRNRGITPDELCRGSGFDYPVVSRILSALESDGFIETDLLGRCTIKPKIV